MAHWQSVDQPLASRADQRLTALAQRNAAGTARIAAVIAERLAVIASARAGQPRARSYDGNPGHNDDPTFAAHLTRDEAGYDRMQLVRVLQLVTNATATAAEILERYGPRLGASAMCECCRRQGDQRPAMGAAPTTVGGRLAVPTWLCSACYDNVRHRSVAKARRR